MKPQNAKRVCALEAIHMPPPLRRFRQFFWQAGQSFDDALVANDADTFDAADSIIVIEGVGALDGKPVPDPVRERDREVADAWFARFKAV